MDIIISLNLSTVIMLMYSEHIDDKIVFIP